MKGFLIKSIEDIRAVIQDLRPSILDDLGLEPALKWFVDRRFKDQDCKVFVEVQECFKARLDPFLETTTFRIAQEALTNILKHAKASRVFLRLTCSQRRLTLFIHDNGVGFVVGKYGDRVSTESGSGIGLQGMTERALLVGGKLKIRSSPGRGTHVGLFMML
jgi:two-component system sensor histidine kinase UhpB